MRSMIAIGLAALLAIGLFAAGWMTRGWREASTREDAFNEQARALAAEDVRRQDIAVQYTKDLSALETGYDALPDWWILFVAQRPDLRVVDIGPFGLCIWTAWNGATSAEPCLPGESTEDPTTPAQRETGGSDGQP